jgi:RNA polymerase primary sigma factor
LGDFLEAKDMVTPSDVEETIIRREEVQQLLSALNDREREIIALRYGLTGDAPQTLEELGAHFQITRERVRQIELRALKKLRKLGTDILN